MARGRFDVHAHDGAFAREAARADVDGVEALFDHALEFGGAFVRVVRAHGAHEGALRKGRGDFDGTGDADPHQERRAGIDAALADRVEDELHDGFIAFNGHEDLGGARKRAAASRHVGVDHGIGGIRNDLKVDPGNAVAGVVARVLLVEDLHGVVAKRGLHRRAAHGLFQAGFEFVSDREVGAEFDVVLNDAGVLAEGDVSFLRHFEVGEHRVVDERGEFALLNAPHGFELFENVVGKVLAEEGRELRHDVREALGELSLVGHGFISLGSGMTERCASKRRPQPTTPTV